MSKNKTAMYQGRVVDVIERKGGWTTVLDGMKQIKVRNGELDYKVSAATDKPAKAPKAPKASKPVKAAKPAGGEDNRLIKADLSRYTVADIKTASGRRAVDTGDEVAAMLRGLDLSEAYRVAADETGQTQKALKERYQHLNPGMQRMNLGNLIRGSRRAQAA